MFETFFNLLIPDNLILPVKFSRTNKTLMNKTIFIFKFVTPKHIIIFINTISLNNVFTSSYKNLTK